MTNRLPDGRVDVETVRGVVERMTPGRRLHSPHDNIIVTEQGGVLFSFPWQARSLDVEEAERDANAAAIALLDRETVLALLDEVTRLRMEAQGHNEALAAVANFAGERECIQQAEIARLRGVETAARAVVEKQWTPGLQPALDALDQALAALRPQEKK